MQVVENSSKIRILVEYVIQVKTFNSSGDKNLKQNISILNWEM